jgi:general secretion pathway protein G
MRNRKRAAFTLIEVLLVIAILGMLVAWVVPQLMGRKDQAMIDMAQNTVASRGPIAQMLQLYKLDVGKYPATDEGLKALSERPDSIDEDSNLWKGPYVEDPDSLSDPWGKEYQYKSPGEVNTNGYDLWSNGPDGQEGTEDDIKNWKSDR